MQHSTMLSRGTRARWVSLIQVLYAARAFHVTLTALRPDGRENHKELKL